MSNPIERNPYFEAYNCQILSALHEVEKSRLRKQARLQKQARDEKARWAWSDGLTTTAALGAAAVTTLMILLLA
jgi:hypothetical protein